MVLDVPETEAKFLHDVFLAGGLTYTAGSPVLPLGFEQSLSSHNDPAWMSWLSVVQAQKDGTGAGFKEVSKFSPHDSCKLIQT